MTALGGSAQSSAVAQAQAEAAGRHVDLTELRKLAGARIARITGAEAGCITTGAASGIALSIAALVTGNNLSKVQQLPFTANDHHILLQAGHAVNFGASIEQMISLGGGQPFVIGDTNSVPERLLVDTLDSGLKFSGFLYVQSHHCVQQNMISLERCLALCHTHEIPLVVDAAAEEDLKRYVSAGADLVTYSGGKAFSGPTVGFIAGRRDLIESCELQFRGIGRTMKVGKEQIFGLLQALDEYLSLDQNTHSETLARRNAEIIDQIKGIEHFRVSLKADEAGRGFARVSIQPSDESFPIHDLAFYLAEGDPSIRTRNHHLDEGILLIDPRELDEGQAGLIAQRLKEFSPS